ncbi:hypothetical protein V2I01_12205 [Micromonospora sp. BRA006-A]|nr:hypothetical protein [Micromonospora sp. BRA006-A]
MFGNELADGEGGFLRTGDLGLLRDGQLYVTGRIKELLIVNGRNLYPHDIEVTVRAVDEPVRGVGAAFTVEVPHEELVVVQECRARSLDPAARAAVVTAVRHVLSREFGTGAVSVVLVRPGTVPRTTSGKIQRGLARMLFLTGALGAEHENSPTACGPHAGPATRCGPEMAAPTLPLAAAVARHLDERLGDPDDADVVFNHAGSPPRTRASRSRRRSARTWTGSACRRTTSRPRTAVNCAASTPWSRFCGWSRAGI